MAGSTTINFAAIINNELLNNEPLTRQPRKLPVSTALLDAAVGRFAIRNGRVTVEEVRAIGAAMKPPRIARPPLATELPSTGEGSISDEEFAAVMATAVIVPDEDD